MEAQCKISLQPFTHVSIEEHFLNMPGYFSSSKYLLHITSDHILHKRLKVYTFQKHKIEIKASITFTC